MTALITGASSGLGRALAVQLAADGRRVVLVARRQQALAEVAQAIGDNATPYVLDVSDADRAATEIAALDEVHKFELVVANAGVGPPKESPPWAWETLAQPFYVNFCGAAATLSAPIAGMIARGGGHLVAISSLSSFGALPGSAAYCAPKAGLSMLVDCLRLDLAVHGIAVTNVFAGFIDTPMVAHRDEAMPQLMQPDDAAKRIVTALKRRPATIDLPQPLAFGTRMLAALPRVLRDPIVKLT